MGSAPSFPTTNGGLLKMQDPVTKNWRWRYCALREGYMVFFAQKNDFMSFQKELPISQKSLESADGHLFLLGTSVEQITREPPLLAQAAPFCALETHVTEDGDFVFCCNVSEDMTIYFATNSMESLKDWCHAIKDQIKALPDPGNTHKDERIQIPRLDDQQNESLLEDIDKFYQQQLNLARDVPLSKKRESMQGYYDLKDDSYLFQQQIDWMDNHKMSPRVAPKPTQDVKKRWTELIELAEVMIDHPKHPLEIKNRSGSFFSTFEKCFIGSEFVDWLAEHQNLDRDEAVKLAYEMYELQIFHHVEYSEPFEDTNMFYRFQCHENDNALNMNNIFPVTPNTRSAHAVSQSLTIKLQSLYYKHRKSDGNVDFEALSQDDEFNEFEHMTSELQVVDTTLLNWNQKLTFWINTYNCMVIHAYAQHGICTLDKKFFTSIKYNIGRNDYNLDDIEHGVLRGNQKAPRRLSRQFLSDDPRRLVMLNMRDPRIHFVLTLHTKSCPPLVFLTERNLESCLNAATNNYLQSSCSVTYTCNKPVVCLSPILQWYEKDFGKTKEELIMWAAKYCPNSLMNDLVGSIQKQRYEIRFSKFDWSVKSVVSTSEEHAPVITGDDCSIHSSDFSA